MIRRATSLRSSRPICTRGCLCEASSWGQLCREVRGWDQGRSGQKDQGRSGQGLEPKGAVLGAFPDRMVVPACGTRVWSSTMPCSLPVLLLPDGCWESTDQWSTEASRLGAHTVAACTRCVTCTEATAARPPSADYSPHIVASQVASHLRLQACRETRHLHSGAATRLRQ